MRQQAFENISILLANATSEQERNNLRSKLVILINREDDDRAASVIRELVNMEVELKECNHVD